MLVPLIENTGRGVGEPLISTVQIVLPLRFQLYSVGDGTEHKQDAKPAQLSDGVIVHCTGEQRREQQTHRHDNGKDHSSEVLDCVVDEQLTHHSTDTKQEEMQ